MAASAIGHKAKDRRILPWGRILAALPLMMLSPLFVSLGLWQLDRAEQSETGSAEAVARADAAPLAVGAAPLGEQALYRRATAYGRFEPDAALLLDNRKQNGRNGRHLLVPMRLEGSDTRLLVNLGWQPREADTALPADGVRRVHGLLAPMARPALLLGAAPQDGPLEVWLYLDREALERRRGYPVQPFVLISDPVLADAVLEQQRARADKWGMHIGYALQWFTFALLAVVLFGVALRLRREART